MMYNNYYITHALTKRQQDLISVKNKCYTQILYNILYYLKFINCLQTVSLIKSKNF